MSWTDVFPILDDQMVQAYLDNCDSEVRAEYDSWFDVEEIFNESSARHVVSVSLFWRNTWLNDPELPIIDRETLLNAKELGLVERFAPWGHYVQPLLDGARRLKEIRPDVAFRVYLARDLSFLIGDLVEAGCEIHLMKCSSIRHNPGAMWRFLAYEEEDRLVTVIDADRALLAEADIQRTESMAQAGLGFWRVPVWGEINNVREMNYRPIIAGQSGSCRPIPSNLLMKALIWHTVNGSIRTLCTPPLSHEVLIYGTRWPDYGFDEWFLQAAIYPRVVFNGVLTFIPAVARSRLLPLDIEYCTWANKNAELVYC